MHRSYVLGHQMKSNITMRLGHELREPRWNRLLQSQPKDSPLEPRGYICRSVGTQPCYMVLVDLWVKFVQRIDEPHVDIVHLYKI